MSGKDLVDMISHVKPAKAKDGWLPKPTSVALRDSASKNAKIICWLWVQKDKELYPIAKPKTNPASSMLGGVLMKQAVAVGKERKKRKEEARKNALAEKDRKLKAKRDQQQKKKEVLRHIKKPSSFVLRHVTTTSKLRSNFYYYK